MIDEWLVHVLMIGGGSSMVATVPKASPRLSVSAPAKAHGLDSLAQSLRGDLGHRQGGGRGTAEAPCARVPRNRTGRRLS